MFCQYPARTCAVENHAPCSPRSFRQRMAGPNACWDLGALNPNWLPGSYTLCHSMKYWLVQNRIPSSIMIPNILGNITRYSLIITFCDIDTPFKSPTLACDHHTVWTNPLPAKINIRPLLLKVFTHDIETCCSAEDWNYSDIGNPTWELENQPFYPLVI